MCVWLWSVAGVARSERSSHGEAVSWCVLAVLYTTSYQLYITVCGRVSGHPIQPEYVFHVSQMTLKWARICIPQHPPWGRTDFTTNTYGLRSNRSRYGAVRSVRRRAHGTATGDPPHHTTCERHKPRAPGHSCALRRRTDSTSVRCVVHAVVEVRDAIA